MTRFEQAGPEVPIREPAFNVPWPVGGLIVVLIGAHALRVLTGVDADRFALTFADIPAGRFGRLLTYQFVHGGWVHVLMNSAFVLAFGAPVATYLGRSARGGLAFLALFLTCGAVAAAAYAAMSDVLDPGGAGGQWALVGASGSASGLMAGAARLIQGQGRPGPITGRVVVGMTLGWIAVNAVLGLSGLTPGAGDVPVAWQAHIFGYICGLVAITPAAWLAGARER